jgi:LacI family transcriptional regulator
MRRKHHRPSLKDVAQAAGVSQTTVSFVLNGVKAKIPHATRERVLAAAQQLDYRPNALARGLRRDRTETLGFVSDEITTTPYAVQLIQGAQDAAWERGHVLLTVNTGHDEEFERRAVETMLDRRVDGIVYATMYHQVVVPPADVRHVPAVLLDCRTADASLPSVVPDEERAAFDATSVLLELGHRRIGFVQNVDPIPAAWGRLAGYAKALQARGIPYDERLVTARSSDPGGGYAGTRALLGLDEPPTGLFCFNDRVAMGAYQAAAELGVRIPDELAIVGFDDLELVAPWLRPPLSTMALPHEAMGRWAVEHLLALIDRADEDGPYEPVQHRMPCTYVARGSAGHAPAETRRRAKGVGR